MEDREKLVKLIEEHIKIANEDVHSLIELEKSVNLSAAKLLVNEMKLDSRKHVGILTAILDALLSCPPSKTLWEHKLDSYIDPILVKKELENHVKMETDVLMHVEREINSTQDEGLKLLFQHIAEDEKRHHKIMETIIKNMYELNR
ncbi:hypothetical protein MUP01_07515 [Candidatus Bathyarchaeota archaeon]|nr:hypothetical protein [Candidatus Bathyarchaeota archaeon]